MAARLERGTFTWNLEPSPGTFTWNLEPSPGTFTGGYLLLVVLYLLLVVDIYFFASSIVVFVWPSPGIWNLHLEPGTFTWNLHRWIFTSGGFIFTSSGGYLLLRFVNRGLRLARGSISI